MSSKCYANVGIWWLEACQTFFYVTICVCVWCVPWLNCSFSQFTYMAHEGVSEQAPWLVWPWTPHSEDPDELSLKWSFTGLNISEVSTSLGCLQSYQPGESMKEYLKKFSNLFHKWSSLLTIGPDYTVIDLWLPKLTRGTLPVSVKTKTGEMKMFLFFLKICYVFEYV